MLKIIYEFILEKRLRDMEKRIEALEKKLNKPRPPLGKDHYKL
jgi:hypothetical protein